MTLKKTMLDNLTIQSNPPSENQKSYLKVNHSPYILTDTTQSMNTPQHELNSCISFIVDLVESIENILFLIT